MWQGAAEHQSVTTRIIYIHLSTDSIQLSNDNFGGMKKGDYRKSSNAGIFQLPSLASMSQHVTPIRTCSVGLKSSKNSGICPGLLGLRNWALGSRERTRGAPYVSRYAVHLYFLH